MRTLTTHKGINKAGGTNEHEGEHAQHEENREALCLPDEAAFVSHAGGAGENGDWKRGSHGSDDGAHFFAKVPHGVGQQGQAEQTRVVFKRSGSRSGSILRHQMHPQPEPGIAQNGETEKDDVEMLERHEGGAEDYGCSTGA